MLRMFSNMNGLGGSLLVVIVLMALVFAASRFDFVSVSLLGGGAAPPPLPLPHLRIATVLIGLYRS